MSDPFEHIDAYMHNQMSEADKIAFEATMLHDGALRSAVENYHLMRDLGIGFLEEEVRHILMDKTNKIQPQSRPKRVWWIAIIIFFLAILSIIVFKYYEAKQLDERIAYAMSDYMPPQVMFTRSDQIEGDSLLLGRAKKAFSLRNYSQSYYILESIPESDRTDEWHWIMGHIQFILQDFEKANSNFDLISDNSYKDDALKMKQKICQIQPSICKFR